LLRYGWSLEKDRWQSISPDLFEASWREVKFSPDSSVLIPESRGIYLVIIESKNILTRAPFSSFSSPIYVGHSIKLRQRFKQHTIGNKDSNLRNKLTGFTNNVHFHFAVFDRYPKDELKKLEQSLIDVFGPQLNSINSISPGVVIEEPIKGYV
jgi:hypothetical protein